MKLGTNEVLVKNKELGTEWIYTVEPEDLVLLEKKGERDEFGNLVLSSPFVAALKKYTPEIVLDNIENYMKNNLKIADVKEPEEDKNEEINEIGNYADCSNKELEQLLSMYGAYRAYLENQLSIVGTKRGVLEALFEEGLNRAFYTLSLDDTGKRKNKEILHGEAINKNPQLKKVKQDLIETEGLYSRISGLALSYKILWESLSRIITLRTLEKGV